MSKDKLKCTDCRKRLTPENRTARYHRCKPCERIRYKEVGLKKKRVLVAKFTENPDIRPVAGFNNRYMVSNRGEVYSVNETKIRKLRPGLSKSGYLLVCLFTDGKPSMQSVHRLVGLAFIENKYPSVKTVINHKDGNKQNNKLENLEWCTFKQNTAHALRTGLQPKGEQIKTAKLSDEKVLFIYQQKGRITQKELSAIFGVTIRVIILVQRKLVWKHISRISKKPDRKLLIAGKRKVKDYTKESIVWEKPGDRWLSMDQGNLLTFIENEDKSLTIYKNNVTVQEVSEFSENWSYKNKDENI